ncbi:HGxxPAAW family protein [Kineosporia sp. R_H_3]|uniref:HGxxPAAW family protein n=1 Tax=Kineosporia sp. R_H_3 TaxID=1961848 RepID=UPI000B4AE442|nr:HGxxPAAW family protein [Kineosporia sp. R_H_3]
MTDSQATTPVRDYEHDHGNSVAAWTGVALIMLGFLVASIGVGILSLWVSIAGGVVVVIGAAAWKVLSSMGYGAGTH